SHRIDCMGLPESKYATCLEETKETYVHYERKVRALQSEQESESD
ncbi:MAG: hypothetical protein ACI87W_002753, partial [Halieaceae bacterium]